MLFMELNIDAIRYGVMHPDFQRQTNFLISRAINMTLYDIRDKQVSYGPASFKMVNRTVKNEDGSEKKFEQMRRVKSYNPGSGEIDRYIKGAATKWTKRGMWIRGSTKSSLAGYLGFKDRDYMKWMVYGGTAVPNKSKIMNPVFDNGKSRIPLNKFGGIRSANKVVDRKKKQDRYFLGHPNNWPKTEQNYGLWEILGAKTKKRRRIRKVIAFDRNRQQKPQYPLPELASQYANQIFGRNLAKAFNETVNHRDFSAPTGRRFGGGY